MVADAVALVTSYASVHGKVNTNASALPSCLIAVMNVKADWQADDGSPAMFRVSAFFDLSASKWQLINIRPNFETYTGLIYSFPDLAVPSGLRLKRYENNPEFQQ